jgi:hypothetical protein
MEMTTEQSLLTKYGFAAQEIARKLIVSQLNERIPTVSDLAAEFALGRGTVQGAIKLLEDNKAVQLDSRGHLGTFLVYKDQKKLLEISGNRQIVGAMPLPYSKKYEGLATGISQAFKKEKFPFNFAYMRGSTSRVQAMLDKRYDFAIVSRLAAEQFMDKNDSVQIALSFGPYSYVSGHAIFVSDHTKERIESGMKVGIDSSSDDQRVLTLTECEGLQVDFVEANYMNLMEMLENGSIDAAIWSKDEIGRNHALKQIPLSRIGAEERERQITEAVCLIDSHNAALSKMLTLLSIEEILQMQRAVETNQILPYY